MGTTYYAANNGSDGNPGTFSQPFLSINKGLQVANPGDTLFIRSGVYNEFINNGINNGLDWNNPITVAAFTNELVTILPTGSVAASVVLLQSSGIHHVQFLNLTFDGRNVLNDTVKITYGSSTGGSHHIRVSGCILANCPSGQGLLITEDPTNPNRSCDTNEILNNRIYNNGVVAGTSLLHGAYITSNNNIIDGNEMFGNSENGMQIFFNSSGNTTIVCSNNVVRNNKFHDNGVGAGRDNAWTGLSLNQGSGIIAYNNLCWNNTYGIFIGAGASGTRCYNNNCYNNSRRGITTAGGVTPGIFSIIKNNIMYLNGADLQDNGSGTITSNNLIGINPLWVSAASGNPDFHLLSNSPAIDSGVTLTDVPVDFDGVLRPQLLAYDIGAFEFQKKNQLPIYELDTSGNFIVFLSGNQLVNLVPWHDHYARYW